MVIVRSFAFLVVAGVAASVSGQSTGQPPAHRQPGYSAFDAMAESYQRGDARRRWLVGRQIALIQDQRRWNGLPPTVPLECTGPGRVSFYAYGNRWDLPACPPVFEPWVDVPGRIWGYPFDDPAPQPVDRHQVQTGPGRWVSYPVYPGDVRKLERPVEQQPIEPQRATAGDQREPVAPPPVPRPPAPRKY